LRSPALSRKELPFPIASSLEHRPNEAKHPAIGYALGNERQKLFVINGPEEISEIAIYDPL
jgi:hypothetical protein